MQNNDILALFSQLTDFQKERIQRELRSYIQFKEFVESSHYAHCPVCGIAEPKIIKKGFLNGKQRVECQSCFHKFVQTRGKLRYNSHQSEAQWSVLIVEPLNAVPFNNGFKDIKRTSGRKVQAVRCICRCTVRSFFKLR